MIFRSPLWKCPTDVDKTTVLPASKLVGTGLLIWALGTWGWVCGSDCPKVAGHDAVGPWGQGRNRK